MRDSFFEFLSWGIVTPLMYLFYFVFAVLATFIIGVPIAVGIKLTVMAVDLIFSLISWGSYELPKASSE